MTDTQWPRYEVFKQDKPNKPHEAIGTVHATDDELALQNARDVHVRRPDCHSLWVASETKILKRTAQQIEQNPTQQDAEPQTGYSQTDQLETYQIFCKKTLRRTMVAAVHVGTVDASTPQHALEIARGSTDLVADPNKIYVWWVVPDRDIIRSEDENIASLFEPAIGKTYKQQSRYGLIQPEAQT